MRKTTEAIALLSGIGLMLVGIAVPALFPHIPHPVALWVLIIGGILVLVPFLHFILFFLRQVALGGAVSPGRVLRDIPYRVIGAARGFLATPQATKTEAVEQAAAVNTLIELVQLKCRPLNSALQELFRDIYNRVERTRRLTFNFLVERQKAALGEATRDLENAVDGSTSLKVLCDAVSRFHKEYVASVRCLHDYGREGIDLTEPPFSQGYAAWEDLHRSYCERLREIREHKWLSALGGAVDENSLFSGEGWRWHSLYWNADNVLATLSPLEQAFLRVFTDDNPEELMERNSPVMLFSVYSAGLGLVAKRLLRLQRESDGIERFEICEPARERWFSVGPSPFPRRKEVALPLRNVYSSGASGGGAPRGRAS